MRTKPKKLTEKQVLSITNDISENINNKQTLEQLRPCVTYWAGQHADLSAWRASQLSDVAIAALQAVRECKPNWTRKAK